MKTVFPSQTCCPHTFFFQRVLWSAQGPSRLVCCRNLWIWLLGLGFCLVKRGNQEAFLLRVRCRHSNPSICHLGHRVMLLASAVNFSSQLELHTAEFSENCCNFQWAHLNLCSKAHYNFTGIFYSFPSGHLAVAGQLAVAPGKFWYWGHYRMETFGKSSCVPTEKGEKKCCHQCCHCEMRQCLAHPFLACSCHGKPCLWG